MKYLNILVLLFFISACSEKPADMNNQLKYEKDGLSFSYPANWEVTEDFVNEDVRFVFVESPGYAIIKIEVYPTDQSFELKEFVELDIEARIKAIPSILNLGSDNEIKEAKTFINGTEFNGFKYEFNISVVNIDVPHVSESYSFASLEKVAYLTNQVATEDLEKVTGGFKQVLSTFKIEP
ncbi:MULTISPECIES: hypothetical protein [unclassified Vibrio]|uniref:hypothetical protein n=1 Tax=unclassified Vibrio TaxID=2614977 RepID=UPI00354E36A8